MPTESVVPPSLSEFKRVPCNICGSYETRLIYRKWILQIVQCVECGLIFVNPRGFVIEPDDYFEGPYLANIEPDGKLDPIISQIYDEVLYNLGNRVPVGRLLDVGCAMGHFIGFAQRQGWEAQGVECSRYAARYAEQRFKARIYNVCALEDAKLPDNTYNCSVLAEVIEHLPDPRATVQEIWRVLQPGGLIYLTTPNFRSYASLLLRDEWKAIVPTGHLYYFDATTLQALLHSVGFINIENLTIPGNFCLELELALRSGRFKNLRSDELARIWETVCNDLLAGPANGRHEQLSMCARKPWDMTGLPPSTAPVFRERPKPSFEGCLVRKPGDAPDDQKVYFIEQGHKRWVTTADWILARGLNWPEDVQFITAQELDEIPAGRALPDEPEDEPERAVQP